jgi:predicted pyridoxine 5'-phosphate oxidase superfamily flavin-nucleotide-binding protein
MPEQHREFFRQLPFVLVGSVDAGGQPWASVLANPPGFIESPDPRRLVIRARPLGGDPLNETLTEGAPIGLLGIEPHTRRRNRMNGVVEQVTDGRFTVGVQQSFGNCPKYIQARRPEYMRQPSATHVMPSDRLDEGTRAMIRRADTLFIATAHPAAATDQAPRHGVDVSHRGGKPGFVRVDDERTLTIPDFAGNFFFNTLGNIAVNPKAGLLFLDFTNGDLAYLAGDAEIIWEGGEVAAFAGAKRSAHPFSRGRGYGRIAEGACSSGRDRNGARRHRLLHLERRQRDAQRTGGHSEQGPHEEIAHNHERGERTEARLACRTNGPAVAPQHRHQGRPHHRNHHHDPHAEERHRSADPRPTGHSHPRHRLASADR